MMAMSMVIVFGFLYIFGDMYQDIQKEKRQLVMEDYANSIQIELMAASQMTPGFRRILEVPQKLEYFEYDIVTQQKALTVLYEGGEVSLLIPPVSGSLVKGQNVIENRNGTLCLNC